MRKFKLNGIDNDSSVGNIMVGKISEFNYDGVRFYFGSIYSSTVKSIESIDGDLIVQTRNSRYVFVQVDV